MVTAKPDYHVPTLVVLLTKKKKKKGLETPKETGKMRSSERPWQCPSRKGEKWATWLWKKVQDMLKDPGPRFYVAAQPDLSHRGLLKSCSGHGVQELQKVFFYRSFCHQESPCHLATALPFAFSGTWGGWRVYKEVKRKGKKRDRNLLPQEDPKWNRVISQLLRQWANWTDSQSLWETRANSTRENLLPNSLSTCLPENNGEQCSYIFFMIGQQ